MRTDVNASQEREELENAYKAAREAANQWNDTAGRYCNQGKELCNSVYQFARMTKEFSDDRWDEFYRTHFTGQGKRKTRQNLKSGANWALPAFHAVLPDEWRTKHSGSINRYAMVVQGADAEGIKPEDFISEWDKGTTINGKDAWGAERFVRRWLEKRRADNKAEAERTKREREAKARAEIENVAAQTMEPPVAIDAKPDLPDKSYVILLGTVTDGKAYLNTLATTEDKPLEMAEAVKKLTGRKPIIPGKLPEDFPDNLRSRLIDIAEDPSSYDVHWEALVEGAPDRYRGKEDRALFYPISIDAEGAARRQRADKQNRGDQGDQEIETLERRTTLGRQGRRRAPAGEHQQPQA